MADPFLRIFFFFIICYCQEGHTIFTIQPPSEPLVLTYGSTAVFQCAVQNPAIIERIDWQLFVNESIQYRGVFSIPDQFGVQDSVSGSEIHSISIPIRKNGITNNTKVRCVAVLLQGNNEMNSQNGTIIIQGPLTAVNNLISDELIPGRSILLSWVAPFTLNVTNTEPDITYCVDVYINMDQRILHHSRSTCGITATAYNMTFNKGEVTPCDIVSVTVTPVNGLPDSLMNGISRNLSPVYLFKGLRNFSSSDIEISSRQLSQYVRVIKFNIQLPDSFQQCRSGCTVHASSSSASYDLGPDNSLMCERNLITFMVFEYTTTRRALPINGIYFINILVANSAGTGYSVGDIQLSTHAIQQVEAHVNADDSVSINLSFINQSLAKGAQVIFKPQVWSETTCKNLIIKNIPKFGDSLSSTIRNIPRGSYTINIYTLNRDGVPDSPAKPVTPGMNISINSNTDPAIGANDVSVEYINENIIIIKYPARPDGYIVLLYYDSSEYSSMKFPGNRTESTVVIPKGTTHCLSLFPLQENGIIYSNMSVSVFIHYPVITGLTIVIVVVIIIMTIIVIMTMIIILFCHHHKSKKEED